MRTIIFIVIGLLPLAAAAADTSMTRIEYRFVGKEIVPGTFSASSHTVWIAGNCCIRVEEAPDPIQHIHGVIITREPDSWHDNTARHFVDPGPTFNVTAPVFALMSKELDKLMGGELIFFRQHLPKSLPDRRVDGVDVSVQSIDVDGRQVELLVRTDNGKPFQLTLSGPQAPPSVRYEAFVSGLPFDRTLFALPAGVRVVEEK